MAQNGTYNGWPNYETWNVMLWMDNEEQAYKLYREHVRMAKRNHQRFTIDWAQTVTRQAFGYKTPDGVYLDSPKIRWGAIAEAMREEAA